MLLKVNEKDYSSLSFEEGINKSLSHFAGRKMIDGKIGFLFVETPGEDSTWAKANTQAALITFVFIYSDAELL